MRVQTLVKLKHRETRPARGSRAVPPPPLGLLGCFHPGCPTSPDPEARWHRIRAGQAATFQQHHEVFALLLLLLLLSVRHPALHLRIRTWPGGTCFPKALSRFGHTSPPLQ